MNLPKVQAFIAYIVVAIFFAWLGYQIYTAWLNKGMQVREQVIQGVSRVDKN